VSFIWPPGLLALLLIPLGIFVARSIERSRARRIAAVGGLGLPSAGAADEAGASGPDRLLPEHDVAVLAGHERDAPVLRDHDG